MHILYKQYIELLHEYNAPEEPKEPTFTVNTNYIGLTWKNAGF